MPANGADKKHRPAENLSSSQKQRISSAEPSTKWGNDICTECEGQIPPGKKVHHSISKELRMVCAFLVNPFLRPPDLKNLRNRDMAVIKNRGTKYLRISVELRQPLIDINC